MKGVIPSGQYRSESRDFLGRLTATLKRIVGMPNYEAYVAHLREHHPECPLPSEREYFAIYLKGRYEGVGNRCC